jgi:hypothetical protein
MLVVHLAMHGTACWVAKLLLELVTAVAIWQFEGGKLVTVWVVVNPVGLVLALLVLAILETVELVAEELVEAVVVVEEVVVELVAALRAWNVGQLKFFLSSFHCKVQSGSAETPGPDIDDTLHLLVKEGLLTLAEWDHDHKFLKLTAMAK